MRGIRRTLNLPALLMMCFILLTFTMPVGSAWAGQNQSIELPITGMTCAACSLAVKTVLKRLDGIHQVRVSFEKKTAVVIYNPQQVTPEQMAQAVNDTGKFGTDLHAVENYPQREDTKNGSKNLLLFQSQ
ncbi:heavy-metal-associated domain-containing protein [Desulfoluna butyratoxydans]|uniref:Heavy metal-associated domain hma n=1 Tax=Desulfoluna butyratoxydans TaxID=231438 RepID=A0A4U8YK69_9BACT|nr:heavy metal-associated domain-containing protein [Desulfoluna butyratoxydans]VFQ43489.1 heavy metal-associated domain hma [Desulfoluna butyratoxydans]